MPDAPLPKPGESPAPREEEQGNEKDPKAKGLGESLGEVVGKTVGGKLAILKGIVPLVAAFPDAAANPERTKEEKLEQWKKALLDKLGLPEEALAIKNGNIVLKAKLERNLEKKINRMRTEGNAWRISDVVAMDLPIGNTTERVIFHLSEQGTIGTVLNTIINIPGVFEALNLHVSTILKGDRIYSKDRGVAMILSRVCGAHGWRINQEAPERIVFANTKTGEGIEILYGELGKAGIARDKLSKKEELSDDEKDALKRKQSDLDKKLTVAHIPNTHRERILNHEVLKNRARRVTNSLGIALKGAKDVWFEQKISKGNTYQMIFRDNDGRTLCTVSWTLSSDVFQLELSDAKIEFSSVIIGRQRQETEQELCAMIQKLAFEMGYEKVLIQFKKTGARPERRIFSDISLGGDMKLTDAMNPSSYVFQIHDPDGTVIEGAGVGLFRGRSTETAEKKSILEALIVLERRGGGDVTVHCDNEETVKVLNREAAAGKNSFKNVRPTFVQIQRNYFHHENCDHRARSIQKQYARRMGRLPTPRLRVPNINDANIQELLKSAYETGKALLKKNLDDNARVTALETFQKKYTEIEESFDAIPMNIRLSVANALGGGNLQWRKEINISRTETEDMVIAEAFFARTHYYHFEGKVTDPVGRRNPGQWTVLKKKTEDGELLLKQLGLDGVSAISVADAWVRIGLLGEKTKEPLDLEGAPTEAQVRKHLSEGDISLVTKFKVIQGLVVALHNKTIKPNPPDVMGFLKKHSRHELSDRNAKGFIEKVLKVVEELDKPLAIVRPRNPELKPLELARRTCDLSEDDIATVKNAIADLASQTQTKNSVSCEEIIDLAESLSVTFRLPRHLEFLRDRETADTADIREIEQLVNEHILLPHGIFYFNQAYGVPGVGGMEGVLSDWADCKPHFPNDQERGIYTAFLQNDQISAIEITAHGLWGLVSQKGLQQLGKERYRDYQDTQKKHGPFGKLLGKMTKSKTPAEKIHESQCIQFFTDLVRGTKAEEAYETYSCRVASDAQRKRMTLNALLMKPEPNKVITHAFNETFGKIQKAVPLYNTDQKYKFSLDRVTSEMHAQLRCLMRMMDDHIAAGRYNEANWAFVTYCDLLAGAKSQMSMTRTAIIRTSTGLAAIENQAADNLAAGKTGIATTAPIMIQSNAASVERRVGEIEHFLGTEIIHNHLMGQYKDAEGLLRSVGITGNDSADTKILANKGTAEKFRSMLQDCHDHFFLDITDIIEMHEGLKNAEGFPEADVNNLMTREHIAYAQRCMNTINPDNKENFTLLNCAGGPEVAPALHSSDARLIYAVDVNQPRTPLMRRWLKKAKPTDTQYSSWDEDIAYSEQVAAAMEFRKKNGYWRQQDISLGEVGIERLIMLELRCMDIDPRTVKISEGKDGTQSYVRLDFEWAGKQRSMVYLYQDLKNGAWNIKLPVIEDENGNTIGGEKADAAMLKTGDQLMSDAHLLPLIDHLDTHIVDGGSIIYGSLPGGQPSTSAQKQLEGKGYASTSAPELWNPLIMPAQTPSEVAEQQYGRKVTIARKPHPIFTAFYARFPEAKNRNRLEQWRCLDKMKKIVETERKKDQSERDFEEVLSEVRERLQSKGKDGKAMFTIAEIEYLVNTGVFGEEIVRVAAEERTALEGLVQEDVKVMVEKFRVDPGMVYRLGNVEVLGKIAVELGVKVSDGMTVGKMQEEIAIKLKK